MKLEFQIGSETISAQWERGAEDFCLKWPDRELRGQVLCWEPPGFTVKYCEHVVSGYFFRGLDFVDIHLPKGNYRIRLGSRRQNKATLAAGSLSSPMPGKVVKVFVKVGDEVKKGDTLMMLEAMKMEHKILAPQDGRIQKIHFQENERVGQEVELLEIESAENEN